jgi:predicted RNA-binding protein with RPS1 domain
VLSADPKAKRIALSVKALETGEEPKRARVKKAEETKPAVEEKLSQLASRFRTR